MKILFVPNLNGNPYLSLMARALIDNKVEGVAFDRYQTGWPSLFKTARKNRDCIIIHIHWIHPYIEWFFWSKSDFKKRIKLFLYVLDILLVKITGKKIIWTIHNKFIHESQDLFWERRLRKILVKLSDKVLVHSAHAIKEIKKAYGLKSTQNFLVIPHGNYIDAYPNIISRDTARRKLNIDTKKKVFLYFGAVRHYKGIFKLIKEFKHNGKLKEAVLLLAGKPFYKEIERDIMNMVQDEENIRPYLFFIQDEDIQLFMNAADIAIFPYEDILTSGSVMLAMSFAKPIIVSRRGCLVDLLDTKGALFFDDINTLSNVMVKALDADFESMGAHNKEIAMKFGWDKIGCDLKAIYTKVLNKRFN